MDIMYSIESDEAFTHVIEEILDNLYVQHKISINILNECSVAVVKDAMKDIIFKTDGAADGVYELLVSKGLNKERSKIVSCIIERRKSELLYSTVLSYNSEHGETVTNFDWVVKLIYGISELKKLKYPLFQLALITLTKGHQQQRLYDISKDMLDNVINVLENIDSQS